MTSLMMMSDDVGSIKTKEEALADLKRQYNSPGEPLFMCGISGIKNYYDKILSTKDIKNFLARSRAYTTHYEFKPPKYNPFYIRRLRQQFQLDLTEVSKISRYNDGVNFLLLCIDVFSRKLWVRVLKRKTAKETLTQLKNIIDTAGKPETIHSDRGTEMKNKLFLEYCKENNIKVIYPFTTHHAVSSSFSR